MWTSVKTWALAASAGVILAACGGGDEKPYPYGAIVLNATKPAALIVTNFVSQAKANEAAISRCGEGCAVVLEFSGNGTCGALATGGGKALVWGVATGASQGAAESDALASCKAKGGLNCSIPTSIPGKCM